MWLFYICAFIPVFIGLIFLWKDSHVNWIEWLIGSGCAFILAALLHTFAVWGVTADVETWSGQIIKTSHYLRWVERYEESHTRTVGSGKNEHTETYYTTEYDTHPEHWTATRTFGSYDDEVDINENLYDEIYFKFGRKVYFNGKQSYDHFDGSLSSGDRSIYSVNDDTGYVYPITTEKHFENRIKAAPSVFSYSQVPTNIMVYNWPNNNDWLHSDRLLGTSSLLISRYKWDCMNTSLGSNKKVNVIMVGFNKEPEDYAHYQESKFIGGKKNDLIICFGGATKNKNADWTYVFGWTENELVKKDLETILLNNPINDDIIPLIQEEIGKNYVIKDWKKFDYIVIQPPKWSYWTFFLSLIITQTGLYIYFHFNEFDRNDYETHYSPLRRNRFSKSYFD